MASLKELRNKIGVIESTRKVTQAMKLVAGVKLRKAEQKSLASREYAQELNSMLARIRRKLVNVESELFQGRKHVDTVLLIIFASDRGLCGNFNYLVCKETLKVVHDLHLEGKKVKIICVGNKLKDLLRKYGAKFESIEHEKDFFKTHDLQDKAKQLADRVVERFFNHDVDQVRLIYTHYHSALNHSVECKEIIPLACEPNNDPTETIFEPSAEEVLKRLLPFNVAVQIYQAILESVASEQGSRMTSMDNATRNADNLLSEFKMKYNRTRQAKITLELVEVISGAKAISGE